MTAAFAQRLCAYLLAYALIVLGLWNADKPGLPITPAMLMALGGLLLLPILLMLDSLRPRR